MVPPLSRIDLDGVQSLVNQRKYFVLHAPRQTGKTSCLNALAEHLNAQGKYRACYINVEIGQPARDDTEKAFSGIDRELVWAARAMGEPRLDLFRKELASDWNAVNTFSELLGRWAELDLTKPAVLIIDEVDALVGDTLITLLRLLRTGYNKRPRWFPSSVILCGIRDVWDYRLFSSAEKTVITGGSAFNIKAESLRLGDFNRQQVEMLLSKHTAATGQIFTPEASNTIWSLTQGQPWLVNALAYQACFVDKQGKDRSHRIDHQLIDTSKEALISRRDTHVDQLADKLREKRVHQVIQPILAGSTLDEVSSDDLQYCLDLGLVRETPTGIAISNPIYREVIPRELTWVT